MEYYNGGGNDDANEDINGICDGLYDISDKCEKLVRRLTCVTIMTLVKYPKHFQLTFLNQCRSCGQR